MSATAPRAQLKSSMRKQSRVKYEQKRREKLAALCRDIAEVLGEIAPATAVSTQTEILTAALASLKNMSQFRFESGRKWVRSLPFHDWSCNAQYFHVRIPQFDLPSCPDLFLRPRCRNPSSMTSKHQKKSVPVIQVRQDRQGALKEALKGPNPIISRSSAPLGRCLLLFFI